MKQNIYLYASQNEQFKHLSVQNNARPLCNDNSSKYLEYGTIEPAITNKKFNEMVHKDGVCKRCLATARRMLMDGEQFHSVDIGTGERIHRREGSNEITGHLEIDEIPEDDTDVISEVRRITKYPVYNEAKANLNELQYEAYLVATGSDENVFISGSPGTGKSFSANMIAKKLIKDGKSVIGCAVSNKAKKVLANSFDSDVFDNVGMFTVAQVLGYSLNEKDGSPETIHMSKSGELKRVSEGHQADVIIVDEVGMCPNEHLEELKSRCNQVIALGDVYQLKVVDGTEPSMDEFKTVILEENMRQGTKETTLINQIEIFQHAVKTGDLEVSEPVEDETFEAVDSLLPLILDETIDVIGCYTNNVVQQYNDAIQMHKHNTVEPVKGDKLVLQRPMFNVSRDGGYNVLHNNGDIIKVETTYKDEYGYTHITGSFGDRILIDRADFKSGIYNIWNSTYKYKKGESVFSTSRLTYSWMQFKSACIEARLPYAQTIHKLQGSTYNKVGLHIPDISVARYYDQDTFFRLMYVGLSRAKKKVYVME